MRPGMLLQTMFWALHKWVTHEDMDANASMQWLKWVMLCILVLGIVISIVIGNIDIVIEIHDSMFSIKR